MSLNLSDGRPIALITEGKNSGKIVFMTDDTKGFNNIKDKGLFKQLPNTKTRDICFIGGGSGSGKTYNACDYVINFNSIFPENPIYIFSKIKNDASFSRIIEIPTVTFVTLDDEFIKNPLTIDMFTGSLIVFDDIAKLEKNILDKIIKLLEESMHDGRHNDIYIVITSHMLMDYKATRTILNEATSVTFFPASNYKQTGTFLTSYGGFNTKQIREIRELETRSCTFFKGYPSVVLYDHGVYLPNAIVKKK